MNLKRAVAVVAMVAVLAVAVVVRILFNYFLCGPFSTNQATSALSEILAIPSLQSTISGQQFYPPLLCSLVMRVGTGSGVDSGASSK